MMSAAYSHCVIGLLTSIVWTLAGKLDDTLLICVFIRCVGGYSLYVILQLLGLFIIARGLGRVFWGLGGGVQVGGGGPPGKVEFLTEKKKFAKKCSWGLKTQKKKVFFPY